MKLWTEEQITLLKKHYPTCNSVKDIVDVIGMSVAQMYSKAYYLKLKRESNTGYSNCLKGGGMTRFKKGNIPYNKGTKGLTGANKTSFKSGHVPANAFYNEKPHLYTRTRKDGYVERVWIIHLHSKKLNRISYTRYIWEQKYGKLSKNELITFKDGFITDRVPVLEDLKVITRKDNINNNTGVIDCTESYAKRMLNIPNAPEELIKLKQQQLKLNRKINEVLIHG